MSLPDWVHSRLGTHTSGKTNQKNALLARLCHIPRASTKISFLEAKTMANPARAQLSACTHQTLAGTGTQTWRLIPTFPVWKIPWECRERLGADRSSLSSLPGKGSTARGWAGLAGGQLQVAPCHWGAVLRAWGQGQGAALPGRNSSKAQQKPLRKVQEWGRRVMGLCGSEKSPSKPHREPRGGDTGPGWGSSRVLQLGAL